MRNTGVVRNFVMRLGTTDKYIKDVVRYSDSGKFTPVGYSKLRGEAFVFPEKLKDDASMVDLHVDHIMEIVERYANV